MSALYNSGFVNRALSLGTPIPAGTPAKAVDVTQGLEMHIGFEVLSGFTGPATIEFWAVPATAGAPCTPNFGAAYQITEGSLCDITGASIVNDAVVIPAGIGVGAYVWARPRCLPEKFLAIKGASGDFAHISACAHVGRLKAA